MDWMQKLLGGRKFVAFLIVLAAGIYLEINKAEGISTNMVGLMLGLVGTFSVANAAITAKHMNSRKGQSDFPPEYYEQGQQLLGILEGLNKNIQEVKDISARTGTAVVNLGKGR